MFNMMHYWGYGTGFNPSFSFLGFILQILFWGLIIMLVVKLFNHSHDHNHTGSDEEMSGDNSLTIVRERYAKGEINKKEFEQLIEDLK